MIALLAGVLNSKGRKKPLARAETAVGEPALDRLALLLAFRLRLSPSTEACSPMAELALQPDKLGEG